MANVDRVARFAEKINRRLVADAASPDTMRVATASKLRVVLSDCDIDRRGKRNLEAIERALAERGVFARPALNTPGLELDDRIHFTKTPLPSDSNTTRLRWPVEHGFEQFLIENFLVLFPTMRSPKAQFVLPSGARVDILARDSDGTFVVVELKKDVPDQRLVHQVDSYTREVQGWVAGKRKTDSVRAMVITSDRNPVMERELQILGKQGGYAVEWLTYRIEIALEPAATSA